MIVREGFSNDDFREAPERSEEVNPDAGGIAFQTEGTVCAKSPSEMRLGMLHYQPRGHGGCGAVSKVAIGRNFTYLEDLRFWPSLMRSTWRVLNGIVL